MAATQPTNEDQATCPLCDDYSGAPSSVEAHISRMTDLVHQGEVGRAHRDHLQQSVETTDSVETSDDPEESSTEDFPEGGGLPSPATGTEESDDQSDGDGDDEQDAVDVDHADSQDDLDGDLDEPGIEKVESVGIPIPVSSAVLVTGAVALMLVVVWYQVSRSSSSESESEQQSEQQSQQDGMTAPDSGGLMGEF